jgi:prepilin-type N-terminal cleavage/methylation domain-containing protein
MPIRSFPKRGFTLIETLLSSVLVLLVLGLGADFLLPLLDMQMKGGERAELQQRSSVLVEELRGDLSRSTGAGVSLACRDSEILLGIHPADNLAQDGTLVWADELIVYRWSKADRLWQRGVWHDPERRLLPATEPRRLSEAELRDLASVAERSPTRVTSGVEHAEVRPAGAFSGAPTLPLNLQLSLASPSGERRQTAAVLGGRIPRL